MMTALVCIITAIHLVVCGGYADVLFCTEWLSVSFEGMFMASEEKWDTPQSTKTDDGVDDSDHNGCLAAEYPRYDIEIENTYATPVDTAYDKQRKSNFIKHS